MKSETFTRIQLNDDGFKVYSSDYEFILYDEEKGFFYVTQIPRVCVCFLLSDNGPDLVLLIV